MAGFDDAKLLIKHAKAQLKEIEMKYEESLSKMKITESLLVEIKNFMENLRSALDFSACSLYDAYGDPNIQNPKIYFPYAPLSKDLKEFQQMNRIEACIPGISASRPDIASKLESYQHFSSPSSEWLPIFMELNNQNKHQHLTPQVRKERRQLNITAQGGAGISLGNGASISIGKGASIKIGNLKIPGGQKISVDNPAKIIGDGHQTIITWVSYNFSVFNLPVIPFLRAALSGVSKIVNELSEI